MIMRSQCKVTCHVQSAIFSGLYRNVLARGITREPWLHFQNASLGGTCIGINERGRNEEPEQVIQYNQPAL